MPNTAHIIPVSPAPPQEKGPSPAGAPRPEEHSPHSFRNMAVLFTDVVGSTVYFKTHGDVAGRKMLKHHEEIAGPPILEHGGVVVKMLGDSVMSYFFSPREALKAAIKIQQRFQQRNQRHDTQQHIHVRIGVHFGEGLLEERDIFGDVVNMVAKFLPLVHGDEIGVSREVFDQVQGLSQVRFEGVGLPEKEFFPKGFELYRVFWEGNVDLSPMTKTLFYVRPLFRLGKSSFTKAWDKFLKEKAALWGHAIEREEVREDRSLAIIVKDPPMCISMAKRVMESLRASLGMDGGQYLPLQLLIDVGPFVRGNKIALEDLKVDWEEVEPGRIHVSSQAFHLLKGRCEFGIISPATGKQPQPFYCLGRSEGAGSRASGFLYRNALGQGDLSPCFYCGSKRHAASRCPSKRLTELCPALARIGYLSLEQINKLFFSFLNAGASEIEARMGEGADPNDTSLWACRSFYDLKYFYQLRFFRTLWNTREEDWNRVKENREERNYGGLAWIALDCIRVSNLEHAESVLQDSLHQEPEDYKPYCALGILNVERDEFSRAKSYLRKALEKVQTAPQKSFVLFLLSRIYSIQGDPNRALEMTRKVLHLNPFSTEALYEEILLNVRKGKEAVALHQLIRLILSNRDYYVHALIDPELCRLGEMIQPKLKSLRDEARDEANRVICTAREELANLKKWMGEDEREVQEAQSLHCKIEELSKMDGYFAHLDIVHYGNQLISTCRIALQERRKTASRAVREISERYERCSRYAKAFPYPFLVKSFGYALRTIHGDLNRDWSMDGQGTPTKFKEILEGTRRISADLDALESRMQRLELAKRFLDFMGRFLKKTLIFQSANLLLAIILFPIAMYYLGFLIPGLSIPPHHIWNYQKAVLSLGAVSGLLLAGVMSGKASGQGRRSRR